MRIREQATRRAFACRCVDLRGFDVRQRRKHHAHGEQHQDAGHGEIRQVDGRGEIVQQRFARGGVGHGHLRGEIADAVQHQCADDDRREDARDLVADAHHRDALRRTFDRPEDADVGIHRRLQQRQSRTDDEQAAERARIPALRCEFAEQRRAHRHDEQAERDALLHARGLEDP